MELEENAKVKSIQNELIKLLYDQIPIGLWAESFAALALTIALWNSSNNLILIIWLIFNLSCCGLARHILTYCYYQRVKKITPTHQEMLIWLWLFTIGVGLSGISWGLVGSLLMVKEDVMRQAFNMFLVLGVTAAANVLYSTIRRVYSLFLILAFTPLALWFAYQGGIFILLSVLSLIYMLIMFASSFYAHNILARSLALRYRNQNLLENLSDRNAELEKSFALVRATLEATRDAILVTDSDNVIEDFNSNFLKMWNVSNDEIKHHDIKVLFYHVLEQLENPGTFLEKIKTLSLHPEKDSFDELLFKDGSTFERYSYPQRINDTCVGRVWYFRDVTSRKNLEEKLFQQSNFNSLTKLPNRVLLLDRAKQAMIFAKYANRDLGILFLDIDRFKLINDTLGHANGDLLLIAVAEKLKIMLKENDILSRETSDEFILICTAIKDENSLIQFLNQVLKTLAEPFFIQEQKIKISVSIGISLYPKDGSDIEMLIRNADIAMYHAKELGRNNFQFYTDEMNKKVFARLAIESQLRESIEKNEFYLLYQPIANLKTGKIVALEALIRWSNTNLALHTPETFIKIAEETGMIVNLGEWVLREACFTLNQLRAHFTNVEIAVNVSAQQFKKENFLDNLQHILRITQVREQCLSLEITESAIMDDIERSIHLLKAIRQLGIKVIVDDFGTGYSSLSYLKSLPVNKLKIDRSFIRDIPHRTDDIAITAAIIALAGKLNLKVVAEGVEHQEQLRFLLTRDCDEFQGYYFSKPITFSECLVLLKKNRENPASLS